MTTYIIEVILCSALFILTYKMLFENERMHLFSRCYLLLSLLFSFIIPVITIKFSTPLLPLSSKEITYANFLQDNRITQILSPAQSSNDIYPVLLIIYLTITTIILVRFVNNLRKILSKTWAHQTISYKNSKIVLIDDDLTPHSFLNYMFINSRDYKNGHIENEILTHELAHIQQKHSYDILLIELLQIVFWFNPLLFFYRQAIQLNHEFLADRAVIDTSRNITGYQYLLIEKASKNKAYSLTSQFDYSLTKKRLIMMTKPKSLIQVLCKQLAVVPVIAISVLAFGTFSRGQDTLPALKAKHHLAPSTQEGVTQELLNEYELIVSKTLNDKGFPVLTKLSDADKNKLEAIYLSMSKAQQARQTVIFMPVPPPLPRSVPTEEQLQSWKNSKIYGLWINDKRASNSELNKYKNTDFAQVFVSKLARNAINYGKHFYQVNLMTNVEYDRYYTKTIQMKNKYDMWIRTKGRNAELLRKEVL